MKVYEQAACWCKTCDKEGVPGVHVVEESGPRRGDEHTYCTLCWESGLSHAKTIPALARAISVLFRKVLDVLAYLSPGRPAGWLIVYRWRPYGREHWDFDEVTTAMHPRAWLARSRARARAENWRQDTYIVTAIPMESP